MDFFQTSPISGEIIGFLGAAILLVLQHVWKARAKLIFGRANNSKNVVFSPDGDASESTVANEIYVEKFFLQNIGKATATKVEFVLSNKPTDISVWPETTIKQQTVGHGAWHVEIPQIAPGELVIITCLYINQYAANVNSVKSAEAVGDEVEFFTQRKYGTTFNTTVLGVFFCGIAFIISLLSKLIL